MSTVTVVIISQCLKIWNHYVVHMKLIPFHMSIMHNWEKHYFLLVLEAGSRIKWSVDPRRESFLVLPASGSSRHALACGLCNFNLYLHHHIAFLSVSFSILFSFWYLSLNLVTWKLLSCVWLFATPWTSPWNSPGQNTGVGSLSLLQGIFPIQRLNPGLLHCRRILYQLSHKGSPSLNSESMLIQGNFTSRSLSILALTFSQINSLSQIQGGHIVACREGAYSTYSKRKWQSRSLINVADLFSKNNIRS